jgi:integrase
MSYYKTKDGEYRVQVDIGKKLGGGRDRMTAKVKTKREAQKLDLEFNMAKKSLRGHSNRVTFHVLVTKYWLPEKMETLRKNTIKGYRRDIDLRLMPAFGEMSVADISHADIQKMLSRCATRKIATNARDTLRGILNYAYDMDLIVKNPAKGRFRFPERIIEAEEDKRKRDEAAWLTSFAEQRRVIDATSDPTVKRLLVLGLCFGLRKGEVLGLRWEDVDFDRREITIRRTVTFTAVTLDVTPPKTERSRRSIPMSDYAFDALKKFRDEGGITRIKGPVVSYKKGYMSPNVFENLFRRLQQEPGMPYISPSNMRHSFATACIREGIDVATVSRLLGHAHITTTYNRYVKPSLLDLCKDTEKISAAYRAG